MEPVCPDRSEQEQQRHFYAAGEAFGTSDSADVEIVVHEPDRAYGREREEGEVGFFSFPEREADVDVQKFFPERREVPKQHRRDDQDGDGKDDDATAHGGGAGLVLVEFGEFRRLAHERFFTDGFSELVLPEEAEVRRNEDERQEERDDQIGKEGDDVVHVREKNRPKYMPMPSKARPEAVLRDFLQETLNPNSN